MIDFEVAGVPAPKGSMRGMLIRGRARVIPGGSKPNAKALRQWNKAVQASARSAVGKRSDPVYVEVPLEVMVVCRLPRPAKHYNKRGTLLPSAPASHCHTVKPDGDKLLRAVLDSLTGIIYDDDARIPIKTIVKQWADRGCEGCTITVRAMPISMQGTLDLSTP